jgi:SAM-dependent methyltransferase
MALSDWYPDELIHAGPEHLDPAYAAMYDRKAGGDLTEEIALLRDLGLNASSTVIDFGAGSGTFAATIAPYCRRVIAVDVSTEMLSLVRSKLVQRHTTNVDEVRAGFLSYMHQGEAVDFIYSRNALHHLPDFWKAIALQKLATLLKPGGVLRLHDLVYSFDPEEAPLYFEPWLNAAPASPDQGWTRIELTTHIREEFSTFSWLLEPMLERAGFEIRSINHAPSHVFSAYTCVRVT